MWSAVRLTFAPREEGRLCANGPGITLQYTSEYFVLIGSRELLGILIRVSFAVVVIGGSRLCLRFIVLGLEVKDL